MKKKRAFLIVLCVIFVLFNFRSFAEEDTDEDKDTNTDLPIYAQSIKEREHQDNALTDIYQINILTEESSELQNRINEFDAMNKQQIQSSLFTEQNDMKTLYSMISEQVTQTGIFNKPHMYPESEPPAQNKITSQIILWSIIFVILGAISFFSALVFQQRKGRQDNVYNNNNENG